MAWCTTAAPETQHTHTHRIPCLQSGLSSCHLALQVLHLLHGVSDLSASSAGICTHAPPLQVTVMYTIRHRAG